MSEAAKIPFPGVGVRYDMPAHIYHAIDALSASALKLLAKSPKHLWFSRQEPVEPTPAMILGTATHTLALEPEKIDTITVSGQCVGTKADGASCKNPGIKLSGGRWYCGVHGKGRTPDDGTGPVLSQADFDTASAMARAVRNDREARRIIDAAKKEVSLFWVESVTIPWDGGTKTVEIPCKARMDILCEDFPVMGNLIADLKTCRTSARKEFESDIADLRYDLQGAFYLDAATKVLGGVEHLWFVFIAVESEPTHNVGVYRCHPEMIAFGRQTYRDLLQVYAYCKTSNHWPGYSDHQMKECNLPPWFIRGEDRELKRVDFK